MSAAVCPYCRCPIDGAAGEQIVCTECGTPHHSDCYAENGGCTLLGCSAAPEDEAKLSVSGTEMSTAGATARASGNGPAAAVALSPAPPPPLDGAAPPPPLDGAAPARPPIAMNNAGSVLFREIPAPLRAPAPVSAIYTEPDPDAKNRMTFILLGVLLGMVGAHNFYAGYKSKAYAQLCISVLTLGFAGPMIWVWAVIDVCTVDQDNLGIKFRS